MYDYKAKYVNNYDGDTVTFMVDLGFDTWKKVIVRIKGINTNELRRTKNTSDESIQKAYEAKEFVQNKLSKSSYCILRTEKDKMETEKYGRYLADILYLDSENKFASLKESLLESKLAVEYNC